MTETPRASFADRFKALLKREASEVPELVHPIHITNTRARAYYDVLNEDQEFRRGLDDLLEHWSETRAQLFAELWQLPARGMADLWWTYTQWRQFPFKIRGLQLGSRSYPGLDDDDDEEEARAASYQLHPPRLRNLASLRRCARRLYERVVRGSTWQAIASAETAAEQPARDVRIKSVSDSDSRWANALGMRLPEKPRGRPRGSKSQRRLAT